MTSTQNTEHRTVRVPVVKVQRRPVKVPALPVIDDHVRRKIRLHVCVLILSTAVVVVLSLITREPISWLDFMPPTTGLSTECLDRLVSRR